MTTAALGGVEPEFDRADRMRKALRIADVGAQEMADYLGVSRNSISNWINGRVAPPTAAMKLWALRTGVSYDWLKTGQRTAPEGDGPGEGPALPRVDSNHQPAGYPTRTAGYQTRHDLAA